MRDIFTDLFNKVLGFFHQTEKKEENAKDVACNRLRVVLMQDRTNLTPELLERMRQELIDLLSKYVEMDKEALELNFEQEGNQMALMLSIPVLRAKEESEIEAAEEVQKEEEPAEVEDAEKSDEEAETSEDNEEKPEEVVEEESQDEEGEVIEISEEIEIVEPENEAEDSKK